MVNTLQQFGVPLGDGQRGGILMPKLKNRFRVYMLGFAGVTNATDFTRQVVTVARPNVNHNPQTLHSYNSIGYYAGKAEYETVNVTVRDDVSNAVSRLVATQDQLQMNFFAQTTPLAAGDYKFTTWVQALDGGGMPDAGVLETWTYEGCFLATINWEEYDYASADAMTIQMAIRFDNATYDLMPPVVVEPYYTNSAL